MRCRQSCRVLRWFFVFKQKTAYELRISDWSSDVCSSDLADAPADRPANLGADLAPFGQLHDDMGADRELLLAFGHEAALGDVPDPAVEQAAVAVVDDGFGVDPLPRRARDENLLLLGCHGHSPRDRKSTRLNSSH